MVDDRLASGADRGARLAVPERSGACEEAGSQVVDYLAAGRAALGCLPTQERIVVERFFDDTEGTQLVIHSPFGAAVNRAVGLKRCSLKPCCPTRCSLLAGVGT